MTSTCPREELVAVAGRIRQEIGVDLGPDEKYGAEGWKARAHDVLGETRFQAVRQAAEQWGEDQAVTGILSIQARLSRLRIPLTVAFVPMVSCPSCHTEIQEPTRFCPHCGAPFGEAPTGGMSLAATIGHETPDAPSSSSFSLHGRFEPGTLLGRRYRIVALIGTGGMGEVYRADDLELGQSVALKFLPDRVRRDPHALERFRREVRLARGISHPNVCRTYDITEIDGHVFLVMEYIDGEDLASVLRRLGRPSADKAAEIARQLCLGLAAAHDNGVLHRDLKPANVMIDERGRARITDFGLAGLTDDLVGGREFAGTPGYMAPEQLIEGQVSTQSDVYALGLVLYEIFTGRRALEFGSPAELARAHSAITTPSNVHSGIDPAVERVILQCLDRDTSARPSSAYAVLGGLPGGDPIAAAVAAGETPSPELIARAGGVGAMRPSIATASLLVGLVMLLVIAGFSGRPFGQLSLSTEVLWVRATELLDEIGHEQPRYHYGGLDVSPEDGRVVDGDDAAAEPRPREPSLIYWVRWSPTPLQPPDLHTPRPTRSEPPQSRPGSATTVFDTDGHLLLMTLIPRPSEGPSEHPIDWSPVLAASGFEGADLTVDSDHEIPPHCDAVMTWRGSDPGEATPVTLVAGSNRGRPTYFSIETDAGATSAITTPPHEESRGGWVGLLLFVVLPLGASLFLAYRNLRFRRGDLRGATVVAVIIVAAYMLESLFALDVSELGLRRTLRILLEGMPAGHALLHAVGMWLAYVAIEPYIRKLWPRMFVGWQRLISGRFRDPVVGQSLLVGALIGAASGALLEIVQWAIDTITNGGGLYTKDEIRIHSLTSVGHTLESVAHSVAVCFLMVLTFLVLLLLMRLILRGNRAAVVGMAIVYAIMMFVLWSDFTNPLIGIAFSLIWTPAVLFTCLRFGFLALLAFGVIQMMRSFAPWSLDVSTWYADRALIAMTLAGILMLYGFATALGGQSLMRDPILDGEGRAER